MMVCIVSTVLYGVLRVCEVLEAFGEVLLDLEGLDFDGFWGFNSFRDFLLRVCEVLEAFARLRGFRFR